METNETIKIQENYSPSENISNSENEEEQKEQFATLSYPTQQPEFVAITSSRSRNSESQVGAAQGSSPKAETLPLHFPNNDDLENSEISLNGCDTSNAI